MTRLLMLVEGQSEEIFVKKTLTPYLAERGVYIQPPIVLWTKRISSGSGYRGGVSNWNQIHKSLAPLLFDSDAWVTTLLDFYGLPNDVPGYLKARSKENPRTNVEILQTHLATKINHPRFIPFFALHEFEAWIFSSPDVIATHFDCTSIAEKIHSAIAHAGEPEFINHGESTHPKARLKAMTTDYKETSDGPTLMEKIGIPVIRASCPHFAAWLNRLEALAVKS